MTEKISSFPKKSPVQNLSRLEEAKARDPVYLCQYWEEHQENFTNFVNKMLEINTIIKLTSNARSIAMDMALKSGIAPPNYIQQVIGPAYLEFEKLVSSKQSGKQTLLDGMNMYFGILSKYTKISGKESGSILDIASYFSESQVQNEVEPYAKTLLKNGYEPQSCARFFWPQLLLFFLRFLDIYDSAIKGSPTDVYMKNLEKSRNEEKVNEIRRNPESVKKVWKEANSETPKGPAEPFLYTGSEDGEASNPALEQEIEDLKDSQENARLDLQALWNYKGKEFKEAWNKLSEEERKKHIEEARTAVSSRGKAAVVYCPELDPDDLAADSGKSMLNLIDTCNQWTNDVSNLDSFTSSIAMKLKAQGKPNKRTLATIIYSRRFILATFCVNMMFLVLHLGEEQEEKEKEKESIASLTQVAAKSLKKLSVSKTRIQDELDQSHEWNHLFSIEQSYLQSIK